jgi:hypothetical protein
MGTSMTPDRLAQVVAKLALNFGRSLDGTTEAAGLLDMWQTGIGGCSWEDVQAALNAVVLDPEVSHMPTVAQFRQRVIACNRARRQAAADAHDGETVDCTTCDDTGWLDQGPDPDGYGWVATCPQGCLPPATNRIRRAAPRRRAHRTPREEQLALAQQPLLREAIATTNRMQGDHGQDRGPLDEPF